MIDVYVNVNIKAVRIGVETCAAVTTETTTFGIGELAQEFGITARAIRFYEDRGMITPRRIGSGGRVRVYSQRDRARLTLLLRGKRLGLSLSDIKTLLDMYETPADSEPQLNQFLALLEEHRLGLQRQLTDLSQLLAEIDRQRDQALRALAGLRSAKGQSECRITDAAANTEEFLD